MTGAPGDPAPTADPSRDAELAADGAIPSPAEPATSATSAISAISASDDWQRLHPLSPLLRGGFVLLVVAGILIASLRDRLIELFIADEFISYYGPNESDLIDYLVERRLIVVALAVVFGAVLLIIFLGWLSWRFNTYRITAEAVEERSGVLFRQHRRAPLDRVQSVNLQRPLLARAVGLTQVNVQTAGQGGRVALRYLGHRTAKEVRERILRDAAAARRLAETPGGAQAAARGRIASAAAPGLPAASGSGSGIEQRARDFLDADIATEALRSDALVSVPLGRLIGSILLSWDLLMPALIAVASIAVGTFWNPLFLLLVLPFGLALVGVTFGQFNRGFRFTLSQGADGVRVGAGLTATVTETIPFGRIHAFEARQPLGWRPFGWWKVRITTAGHAVSQGGQNRLQNTVLPVGPLDDVLRVFAAMLPAGSGAGAGEGTEAADAAADADALLDALVGRGEGFLGAGPRAGWVLWFGRRRAGIRLDGVAPGDPGDRATLRVRRGALTRSLGIMPMVRAQSVQLRRPLVHRLLGLASVQAHTVLGPVRMEMRGLGLSRAREVFDLLAATAVRAQTDESLRRSAGELRGPEEFREPEGPQAAGPRGAEPPEGIS